MKNLRILMAALFTIGVVALTTTLIVCQLDNSGPLVEHRLVWVPVMEKPSDHRVVVAIIDEKSNVQGAELKTPDPTRYPIEEGDFVPINYSVTPIFGKIKVISLAVMHP